MDGADTTRPVRPFAALIFAAGAFALVCAFAAANMTQDDSRESILLDLRGGSRIFMVEDPGSVGAISGLFSSVDEAEQYVGWRLLAADSDAYVARHGVFSDGKSVQSSYESTRDRRVAVMLRERATDDADDGSPLLGESGLVLRTKGGVLVRLRELPASASEGPAEVEAHFYTGATAADGTPIVATVHAPDIDTAIDFIDSLRFTDGSKIPATTKIPGD